MDLSIVVLPDVKYVDDQPYYHQPLQHGINTLTYEESFDAVCVVQLLVAHIKAFFIYKESDGCDVKDYTEYEVEYLKWGLVPVTEEEVILDT